MRQVMDQERYIELVRQLGIEEAYKQRYRGTGRTVRDVLDLVMRLSRGETVEIHTDARPGHTLHHTRGVLCKIVDVCHIIGMTDIDCKGDRIMYPPSGGSIRAITKGCNRMGERIPPSVTLFELHEC